MTLSEIAKRYSWRNPNSSGLKLRRELIHNLLVRYDRPSVLDIGGTSEFWMLLFDVRLLEQIELTCLNLRTPNNGQRFPQIKFMLGDARKLEHISDKIFDIVVAHSLIEHLGGWQQQRKVAENIRRIGKSYFVQTPNLYFPVEPHFLLPLFQFVPKSLLIKMVKRFGRVGNVSDIENVQNLSLLTKKQLRSLFPDSVLFVEKILGLEKSFVAYRV